MDERSDQTQLDLEQREGAKVDDTFSLQSVTEEEANLGRDATKLFINEEYHSCLSVLINLAQKRPSDPRVLTNLAVCKYHSR